MLNRSVGTFQFEYRLLGYSIRYFKLFEWNDKIGNDMLAI